MVCINLHPGPVSSSWIIKENIITEWRNLLDGVLLFGQSVYAKFTSVGSTLQGVDTVIQGAGSTNLNQHFPRLRADQAVMLISCGEVLWYNCSQFMFITCLQMKGAIFTAKYYDF